MSGKLPNLICPGAMKAGTTSLFGVFEKHPDIYVLEEKEANFFDKFFEKGLKYYKNLYKNSGDKKYIADFSPSYMLNSEVEFLHNDKVSKGFIRGVNQFGQLKIETLGGLQEFELNQIKLLSGN